MLISFVIPCYRSENTLPNVVKMIEETIEMDGRFSSEIILVNDGSDDGTWRTILNLVKKYSNVEGINLAKNSGQQNAILAGLRYSRGDLVAVSDDDGQTPIDTIFSFYDKMQEGKYDVVCARYVARGKRSLFRKFGSLTNNALIRICLEKPDDIDTSVYFLAKRFVVDEMTRYTNAYAHIEGLLLRTTHNIGNVDLEQREREHGKSGYNFRKLFSTWIDGLTTFSIKPLRFAVIFGFIMAFFAFVAIIALVVIKLTRTDMAIGWTSVIATNILVGGLIMLVLGVVGEYIGRIYLCINQNPQYVVKEILRSSEEKENKK